MYPVSYHTFLFPFLWNCSGKVTKKTFLKHIHRGWTPDLRQEAFRSDLYNQYVYFNRAARSVIFTEPREEAPVVSNYRFDFGKLFGDSAWLSGEKGADNPVRYEIKKDTFAASLRVNGVRLRLYSTGVGMLVFELENYDLSGEEDIKRINEYGRRIFMPFTVDGACSICADSINLTYPGGEIVSTVSGVCPKTNSHIRFPELMAFLLRNGEYKAALDCAGDKKTLPLQSIIDDRMFVSCVWNNGDFPREMNRFANGEYIYLADAVNKAPGDADSTARRLYEMIFIDGDGITCRSRTMLREMLEKHIYHRWLEYSSEYGTVAGISEFSMVTVTDNPVAINAHLSDYTEMAMLVLTQRATLLSFEQRISECARGEGRISQIQRDYVQFQSKYLLREVTPQQQGIEMYRMLTEHLFIEEMKNDVDGQIDALFDLDQNSSERDDNFLLFVLAGVTVFDAISCLSSGMNWLYLLIALGAIGLLLIIYFFNHRNRIK